MTTLKIPQGTIDAHVHIFDPERFPLQPDSPYTPLPPECGSAADLCVLLDAHGLQGAVLVNPTSGYGMDNACMLDAIARFPQRFRGVARVPLNTTPAALKALARKGVTGIRIDIIGDSIGQLTDPQFGPLVRALADLDMVLQIQCEKEQPLALAPVLDIAPVRMVIDHCGRPDTGAKGRQTGFRALLKLAETGRVAMKLSGAFRFSARSAPYPDTDRHVTSLLSAFGADHCMWGSDWPFIRMPRRIDYGPTLGLVERWIPDARTRRQVLVTTPRRWFGFDR